MLIYLSRIWPIARRQPSQLDDCSRNDVSILSPIFFFLPFSFPSLSLSLFFHFIIPCLFHPDFSTSWLQALGRHFFSVNRSSLYFAYCTRVGLFENGEIEIFCLGVKEPWGWWGESTTWLTFFGSITMFRWFILVLRLVNVRFLNWCEANVIFLYTYLCIFVYVHYIIGSLINYIFSFFFFFESRMITVHLFLFV